MAKRLAHAVAAAALFCGALSTVRGDYASTVLGLNPLVYYHFNDHTAAVPTDTATNAGTLGASADAFYIGQNAGNFNRPYTPGAIAGDSDGALFVQGDGGTNGYWGAASIPWSAALNPKVPWSVEGWVQSSIVAGQVACFASIDGSSAGSVGAGRSGWTMYQNGASYEFRLGNTNGYQATISGGVPNEGGIWDYLVGTCDGTNAVLYVNGASVGTAALSGPFQPNPGETTDIGWSSSFGRYWNGGIDEFAIYSNALTPAQVLAHYQNGTNPSRSISYSDLILSMHPLAYFHLDESAFTFPDPSTYPTALNSGSLGSAANGVYNPTTAPTAASAPFPGFGANTNAVQLNGVISSVEIPPLAGIVTNQFSFACWFKSESYQEGDPGWPGFAGIMVQRTFDVGQPGTGSDPVLLSYWSDGEQLQAEWSEGPTNADYDLLPQFYPTPFVWNFLAVVWSPSDTVVYLNGQSKTIAGSGPHDYHDFSVAPIYLGADPDPQMWGVNGAMAEPALFDYALSPAQVQSLFTAAEPTPQILSVTQSPLPPNFEGETVSLTVAAFGPGTLTYQWRKDGVAQSGSTSASLQLTNVSTTDSGTYDVIVSNPNGSVTSSPTVLTVSVSKPIIVQQPLSGARYAGFPMTLSVTADGSPPISYQWSNQSGPIAGATNSSYTIPSVNMGTAGNYSVLLNNANGSTASSNALVTVLPTPIGYAGAVLAADPTAYWRFNETNGTVAHDYVGGFDGNYLAAVTNDVPGPDYPGLEPTNTSYGFDGNFDVIATESPIPINGASLTVIALASSPNFGTQVGDASILTCRVNNNSDYFWFGASGDGFDLSYDFNNDPNSDTFDPGFLLPTGWAFVAVTVSPTQAVLYIDDGSATGLQVATNDISATPLPGSFGPPVALGGDPRVDTGQQRTWNGGLDEIAYFTRTLSTAEITAIHQALVTAPVAPVMISVSGNTSSTFTLSWSSGTLQSAPAVTGPWTDLPSATSPYAPGTAGAEMFFRLKL